MLDEISRISMFSSRRIVVVAAAIGLGCGLGTLTIVRSKLEPMRDRNIRVRWSAFIDAIIAKRCPYSECEGGLTIPRSAASRASPSIWSGPFFGYAIGQQFI
jgi:hypothetical protein